MVKVEAVGWVGAAFRAMVEVTGEAFFGYGATAQAAVNDLGANLIATETLTRQNRMSGLDPAFRGEVAQAAYRADRRVVEAQRMVRAFNLSGGVA